MDERQEFAQPAASAEPSDEEIEALAHRVCTKYTHADDPSARRYEFGMLTLRQFARALLSRYGRPAGDAQPVAWVAADTLNSPHPKCVSSLAYMSQIDQDRGREYVPLYAAPVAAQKPVEGDATDARDAALEEAARACDSYSSRVVASRANNRAQHFMGASIGASACADAIRAMKSVKANGVRDV